MPVDIEDLGHLSRKPKVTNYNPCTVRNLRPGSIKEWCTCGLTKKGPWCDGKSHKGTSFKPLRWRVPDGKNTQTMYSICDCRYTTRPPFCDGIHYDLPLRYLKKIKDCPKAPHDPAVTKLCEECGWAGPRESWPELPSTDSDESSLSDSDLDEEDLAKKKQLHEEASLKREAANKPKVQVQVQSTAQTQDNGTGDLDSRMEIDDEVQEGVAYKIGCSGACQTDPSEISKIAAEIQRVNLSS